MTGTECVTWAWPGSFLAPSQCHFHHGEASAPTPRRNCFWLICQAPPRNQSRRGGRGQQNRGKGPLPTRVPPICPSPRKQLQEPQPCSAALAKGPRAEEWRGPGDEEGAWHSVSPVGAAQGESGDIWSGPVLQRLLGLGSHRLLCGPEARARGSVSSLPNLGLVPPG